MITAAIVRAVFSRRGGQRSRLLRRHATVREVGAERLERRAMLAGDTAWIKLDLSALDQTGIMPAADVYLQGYANASGQILQYDPALQKLILTEPLPLPVTFEPTSLTYAAADPKAVTLSTAATLIVGAQVTATKADGTSFVSTISSIAANATAADWNGTTQTWSAPGTGGWVVNADAALQAPSALANGTLSDSSATAKLSGLTVAQGAAAGVSLGMLAVGTIPGTHGNSYFFPATTDGRPFPAAEAHPAAVTALSEAGGDLAATFSAATGLGNVNLGTNFLTLFGGGANAGGFATLAWFATNPPADATGIGITVGNLLTTRQILPANVSTPTAPQIGTYMVLAGVPGNVPIKSVESFTVTLADAVPVDGGKPVALTFATSVTGSVASSTSFTIDAATYPGIGAALALGQKPTLAVGSTSSSEHTITQLRQGDGKITVGLSGSLPTGWPLGTPIIVSLPPTGGSLPTYKWNASDAARNAIWARQTATAGQVPAVNGSRIYVSLVQPGQPVPTMQFSVANGVVAVTQFDTAQVWQGQIAASQYVELTADSLGAGGQSSSQGKVYVDLSAVDGFFFPVALSTTIAGKTLLMGQPASPYTAPNTTGPRTYMPVARNEILSAWKDFFDDASNFATGSDDLRQAYAGLRIVNDSIPAGIQNPSFLWSMPNAKQASKNALNAAWNAHLDTLFSGTGQVDLMGDQTSLVRGYVGAVQVNPSGTGYKSTDTVTFSTPSSGGRAAQGTIVIGDPQTGNISGITITDPGNYALADKPTITIHSITGAAAVAKVTALVPAATYYKGVATTVNAKPAIQFTEYAGPPMNGAWQPSYAPTNATGAVFTVYDPRNPPATEPQAFSAGAPLQVGYQILANAGVFASTGINAGNYSFAGTDPWQGNVAAELRQLTALERDIVTALNQGIGGTLRGTTVQPGPGTTAAYWATETNWYPYPTVSGGTYPLATPQNLYSQWVHTAAIDANAQKYYATYPFGDVAPGQDYGTPATNASGQVMNMTYGFGYDESPAHGFPGPNVPSKFLPILNTAGNANDPLTFALQFGPWNATVPTGRPAIDLNGDGIGDTIWRKTDAQGGTVGYVGWLYDAQGEVVAKRGLSKGPDWDLETAAYFTTGPVTDFVWRNTKSNATTMWIMNAEGSPLKQKYIGGKDTPEWQIETSGDYDGDGRTDLVWRQSTTGLHSMWLMNEWHVSDQAIIGGSKTFRLVATAADYDANGDGCTDLIWRDTTSDGHVVHLMQGTAQIGSFAVADGTGWDLVATGNYDTNGIGDLLWREKSTGAVMQWLMTYDATSGKGTPQKGGETLISKSATRAPIQSLSFWGNAIAWRRPADGTYAVWKMLGSSVTSKTPTIGGSTTFELVLRHPRPPS